MKTKIYLVILLPFLLLNLQLTAQNTFPSSGKVGIGTTTPNASSLLEVASTTKGILIPRMTQAQRNAITSPATSLFVYVTDVNPGFYFYSGTAWVGLVAKNTGWLLKGNSSLDSASNFIGTTDNAPFSIRTKNVERVHVSSTGNVGIGVSSPAALLHINGGGAASLTNNGYVLLGKTNNYNLAIDNEQLQARYNGTYADLFFNAYGGSVIVGNTSNSYDGILAEGYANGVYGESPNGTGVYGAGGNFGVYGTSPNGNAVYGTSSGGFGGYFYNSGGDGAEGYDEGGYDGIFGYEKGDGNGVEGDAFGTYGTGVYGYSANNVGVSGYTNNNDSYAGYFQGDVFTTGAYASSDAKLKQNITDMSSAMSIINQLKPKNYNFRNDGNYALMNLPKGKHYGLIAQDVEKILPGLVKDTKFDVGKAIHSPQKPLDSAHNVKNVKPAVAKTEEIIDFKALNYTELIPIMIKGMQEQQQMITAKDASVDSLKSQIANLQSEINQLKAMIVSSVNSQQSSVISSASLQQNIPNPFSSATTIGYNLPANYSSANIIVTDAKGVILKQISLNAKGKGNVQLDASTLASGAYRYSLYVDGRMVDSKQMISSK